MANETNKAAAAPPTDPKDIEIQKLRADLLASKDAEIKRLQNELTAAQGKSNGSAAGPYAKEEHELAGILSAGHKRLSELPKHLQEPRLLCQMMAHGKLEVGRPAHYFQSDPDDKFREKLLMGKGEPSWSALQGASKTLPELLQEERDTPEPIKLIVRLTHKARAA